MTDARVLQFRLRQQPNDDPWSDGIPPWDLPAYRPNETEQERRWGDGFEDGQLWAPHATEAELDCAAHLLAALEGKTSPFLWVIYPGSSLATFWGLEDGPADQPVGDLHSDDRGYAAGFVYGVHKYFAEQYS